jgi:hypothetical protein
MIRPNSLPNLLFSKEYHQIYPENLDATTQYIPYSPDEYDSKCLLYLSTPVSKLDEKCVR